MADRDADAIGLFQRLDCESFLQRAGDRLLGVDVLAGLGDLARERQVLLVGHCEDHALDLGIAQKGRRSGALRTPNSCWNPARLSSERLKP